MLGTAWVTDETEHSLDVEWENPPTEVDYYKLRYSPLGGQEVAEVTVPKSSDPKSRYDITGKVMGDVGCRGRGGDSGYRGPTSVQLGCAQRVLGLRNRVNPDLGNCQA